MNKIFFAVIIITILFASCKKADNDPTLPFSTRDARITKTWELSSINNKITTVNIYNGGDPFTSTKEITFSEGVYTEKNTDGAGSSTIKYDYSYLMLIDKDGKSKTQEIITPKDENTESHKIINSGYWNWANSYKNKVAIVINNKTYQIDRLSRDELIFKENTITEDVTDNLYQSTKVTTSIYMVFKKSDKEID